MSTTVPPNAELLLGCYAQTIFKAAVVEALADAEGGRLFVGGQGLEIPAIKLTPEERAAIAEAGEAAKLEGRMYQLENTAQGQTRSVGELLVFHIVNDSVASITVTLRAKGYGMDVEPESCVNDVSNPVVAVLKPRGLDKPVGPVYTLEEAKAIVGTEEEGKRLEARARLEAESVLFASLLLEMHNEPFKYTVTKNIGLRQVTFTLEPMSGGQNVPDDN